MSSKTIMCLIVIFLFVLVLMLGCAKVKLADYQPKSTEEKEILDFITKCDTAYQSKNFTGWLDCFHDNATIRIWQTDAVTRVEVPKSQYKKYLNEGRASDMDYEIINPKITIMEDRATLKYMNGSAPQIMGAFDLLRERDKWSITKWDWTYQGF